MYTAMIFYKYINKIFCIVFVLCYVYCNSTYAFGNPTHEQLTEIACHKTKMLEQFSDDKQKEMLLRLLASCNIPDAEETDRLMYGHFYDFNDECSDLSKDSALFRMHSHFQNATRLWRSGHQPESIDSLGKSIHYMQDMCCMAHTWGRFYNFFNLDKHRTYENAMDVVAVSYAYNILISPELFNFRDGIGTPIIGVANSYVLKVIRRYQNNPPSPSFWSFFDTAIDVRKSIIGADKLREEAKQVVPFEDFELAYQATCELIYLFFQAVGINL